MKSFDGTNGLVVATVTFFTVTIIGYFDLTFAESAMLNNLIIGLIAGGLAIISLLILKKIRK